MSYDRGDIGVQRDLLAAGFAGAGWHSDALVAAACEADDFYFDAFAPLDLPILGAEQIPTPPINEIRCRPVPLGPILGAEQSPTPPTAPPLVLLASTVPILGAEQSPTPRLRASLVE